MRITVLLLACAMAFSAETAADREKATDMNDADQVLALALMYREEGKATKANQLLNQIIKRIDKDHEGARTAMGQVRVGDKWVPRSMAPAGAGQQPAGGGAAQAGAPARRPGGPGPKAAEVAWDLARPTDPNPVPNDFIASYLDRMNRAGNDSDEMGGCVATLIRADVWPSAFPRLCEALETGKVTDLYGSADIVMQLVKQRRMAEARKLFQFLGKAATASTDQQELSAFCYAAAMLRERKAIPKLIECLGMTAIVADAQAAVAAITLLPERSITPESAQGWWDRNHNASEEAILADQLRSEDHTVAIAAAQAMYELRNKSFVPTVIRVLKGDDRQAQTRAVALLNQAFGRDWSIVPGSPPDERGKRIALLEKWWKEEGGRFQFPAPAAADPGAGTAPKADPATAFVTQLTSPNGDEANKAEAQLKSLGVKAIPALIAGLSAPTPLARRKVNDLLKEISRTDPGFDPRGDDEARAKGIAAWTEWARKAGHIAGDEGEERDAK